MSTRANHNFKPIGQLIDEVVHEHLAKGDIDTLSKQLQRIDQCWARCTSELISQNIRPVRLEGTTLIVQTHHGIWANKMRYQLNTTVKNLQRFGFSEITEIRIRINPGWRER